MAQLKLKIVTPERIVLESTVDSVTAMTENGEITVLPNHIPLATLLRAGEMRVMQGKEETALAVSTGLLEVRGANEIVILADTAERSDELELAAIEEAKKRAEQALVEAKNKDAVAFADAAAHLERELARYRVAMKHKHRGSKTQAPVNE
ncbi:ATP synthase F1 subunit epsilon [Candidatus Uhrbacteria bacterium]|nr:ATP synthase F1 subunit epsilon [Candidatus Uhrbacteria bacterium]